MADRGGIHYDGSSWSATAEAVPAGAAAEWTAAVGSAATEAARLRTQ